MLLEEDIISVNEFSITVVINVVGIGNQLQATVSELSTGQNKRIAVGKELDGYIVKSISLNDGIIFEKDGELESLNIGK